MNHIGMGNPVRMVGWGFLQKSDNVAFDKIDKRFYSEVGYEQF